MVSPYKGLLLGVIIAGLLGLGAGFYLLTLREQGGVLEYAARVDFLGFYIGLRAVATGQGTHLFDLDMQKRIMADTLHPYQLPLLQPFIYPGHSALLLAPLGALPYVPAFLCWVGANLALAMITLRRLVAVVALNQIERLLLLIGCMAFLPLVLTLLLGQMAILSMVAIAGAVMALRTGRDTEAGAWLLLSFIKPQLVAVPLLALMVAGRRKAVAIYLLGMGVIVLLSLLVLGDWIPAELTFWYHLGAPYGTVELAYPDRMQNWRALVWGLLGTDTSPLAIGIIAALTLLSLIVVLALGWPRRARSLPLVPAPIELYFAFATLVGLLAVPHLHLPDMAVALVPGLVFWGAAHRSLATASTGRGRLHSLLLLLALGPVISWPVRLVNTSQYWWGAWYLVILLGVLLLAWPALIAPSRPAPGQRETERHEW